MPTFTYAQLEYIWCQAGGSQQTAALAAAIAMAESGGNSDAISPSNDYGLWQVNKTYHGACATLDVMTNARCAVQISNGGSNWQPWCTAWCPPDCNVSGKSTYLGSCAPFQKYLAPGTLPDSTPVNATNASAGTAAVDSTVQTVGTNCTWYNPLSWFGCVSSGFSDAIQGIVSYIIDPLIQIVIGIFGVLGGIVMVAFGIWEIVGQTQSGSRAQAPAKKAAGGAVKAGVALVAPETAATTAYESGGVRTTVTSRRRPARQLGPMRFGQAQVSTQVERRNMSTGELIDNEARDVAGGRGGQPGPNRGDTSPQPRRAPSGTKNRDRARRQASRSRGRGTGPGGGGVG